MTEVDGGAGRRDVVVPAHASDSGTVHPIPGHTGRQRIRRVSGIKYLAASFAALATLLAAIGLYGVLAYTAYTVAQRTREIGLRMALGANSGQLRRMVLAQLARTMMVGSALGVAGALVLGRAARSLLFEVDTHDPRVLAAAVILLALVALGASYIPARRATRVDPMLVLRSE